jgi:ribonuclease HI
MRILAYIDGGGGREAGAHIGIVATDLDTGAVVIEHGAAIGPYTHNEAEWSALLYALRKAVEWEAEELQVRCDSTLVANQTNGLWAVRKEHLKPYADEARRLISQVPKFSIEWVPRAANAEADALTHLHR